VSSWLNDNGLCLRAERLPLCTKAPKAAAGAGRPAAGTLRRRRLAVAPDCLRIAGSCLLGVALHVRWNCRLALVGLRPGHPGSDARDDCCGDHLPASAAGASCARTAPAGGAHFFRLWLWLTTGMVTKEWAAIHRKHHARCETAEDPHSPQVHGIHRVLWTGVFLYVREARNLDTLQRYGHGTPDDWIERHLYSPWHKLGVLIMLAMRRGDLRRRRRTADLAGAGRLDSLLGGRRDQRPRAFLGLPQLQPGRREHQHPPGES
jgi:hypothetical protein